MMPYEQKWRPDLISGDFWKRGVESSPECRKDLTTVSSHVGLSALRSIYGTPSLGLGLAADVTPSPARPPSAFMNVALVRGDAPSGSGEDGLEQSGDAKLDKMWQEAG